MNDKGKNPIMKELSLIFSLGMIAGSVLAGILYILGFTFFPVMIEETLNYYAEDKYRIGLPIFILGVVGYFANKMGKDKSQILANSFMYMMRIMDKHKIDPEAEATRMFDEDIKKYSYRNKT